MPKISETDLNVLAQRFHEHADGLSHAGVHNKPKIVSGLRAVFEILGYEIVPGVAASEAQEYRSTPCPDCYCSDRCPTDENGTCVGCGGCSRPECKCSDPYRFGTEASE